MSLQNVRFVTCKASMHCKTTIFFLKKLQQDLLDVFEGDTRKPHVLILTKIMVLQCTEQKRFGA